MDGRNDAARYILEEFNLQESRNRDRYARLKGLALGAVALVFAALFIAEVLR